MSIAESFDSFVKSADLKKALDSSTKASWGGEYYVVELFDSGTYRVLWSEQIGDVYDSEGMILRIPALTDEEWDDDPSIRFYENAKEGLKASFEQAWADNLEQQNRIAFEED